MSLAAGLPLRFGLSSSKDCELGRSTVNWRTWSAAAAGATPAQKNAMPESIAPEIKRRGEEPILVIFMSPLAQILASAQCLSGRDQAGSAWTYGSGPGKARALKSWPAVKGEASRGEVVRSR